MKTNETSTRKQALAWWNKLPNNYTGNSKGGLANKYGFGDRKSYNDLTGREIEEIWRKETQTDKFDRAIDELRKESMKRAYNPNQKQFKQFDESLFRNLIDKFSDEGKLKAFRILYKEVLKYYSIVPEIEHNKALGVHQ